MQIELNHDHLDAFATALATASGQPVGAVAGHLVYLVDRVEVPDAWADTAAALDLDAVALRADEARRASARSKVREAIDEFRRQLTGHYSATEQDGWLAMLAEARAHQASGDDTDAPGLTLEAAIDGTSVTERVAAVLAAAEVTGVIPSMAAAMRRKADGMIAATDGSAAEIDAVLATLAGRGQAILIAAQAGDRDAMIAAATSGWE